MNDSETRSHTAAVPDSAVPFDPASGDLPLPLTGFLHDQPLVLLVDASPDQGWAAEGAIELATLWARAGRRVVLADLHFEEPLLHDRLGEANLDGIVDIFLYGASVARSARPAPGRDFYLISAGTYAPDPDAVLRHPRWEKLIAGFRDANASLVAFLPPAAAPALLQYEPKTVVLGWGPRSARFLSSLPPDAPSPVMLTPPGVDGAATVEDRQPEGADAPAVAASDPDITQELFEIPLSEDSLPSPAAAAIAEKEFAPSPDHSLGDFSEGGDPLEIRVVPVAASDSGPAPERGDFEPIEAPPPIRRRRTERRRSFAGLWIALGLAAVGIIGFFAWANTQPGDSPVLAAAEGNGDESQLISTTVAPSAASAEPVPTAELTPYSVQIKAFTSLNAAREELLAEQQRLGGTDFFISPEQVQGILYYKVLAGTETDSAAASELRDRLVAVGAIDREDAARSWIIHNLPLAFYLGEYTDPDQATLRADSLFERGIPVYVARIPFSDGVFRWRLYGGAFRDADRAEGMRQLLTDAGVEAPLRPRVTDDGPIDG